MDSKKIAIIALVTGVVVVAIYLWKYNSSQKDQFKYTTFGSHTSTDNFDKKTLMPNLSVSATEGENMPLRSGEILRSIRPTIQSYYGLYPSDTFKDYTFVV